MRSVTGQHARMHGRVRAGVVARLRERQSEVEQAVFARVCEAVPDPVGHGDAEYVEGLRVAVAAAVEYGIAGLECTDDGSPSIPNEALAQARRAARSGVTLAAVLRRYIVGHALVSEYVMHEAEGLEPGGSGSGGLQDVLRAQAVLLDRMVAGVSGEYAAELERVSRSREQRLAERVQALLSGDGGRGGVGLLRGATARGEEGEEGLEYGLDAEHVGVIATGASSGDGVARKLLQSLATELDRRLLCVPRGEETVWGWLGGQRALAVSELERVIAERWPDAVVCVAVGEPARGFAGWRLTHLQAQAAMVVALRRRESGVGLGEAGEGMAFARYGDVALLASALKDELLARGLVEAYLAPLANSRHGGSVLRETLRAYIGADRSVSSAAAALGVSRSTVEARLRTVEQSLGRLLPGCMAELEVALRLEELGGPAAGGEDRSLPG